MRKGIDFSLVEQVINARPSNVKLEDKKNWLKLEAPNGARVYIAKQKQVRQIDLSGFGKGMYGTIPLQKPNGAVEAHLDLSHERALFHLQQILELMGRNEIVVTEKKRVAPMSASSQPKPEAKRPEAQPLASLPADEKAARAARIRAVAAEKGVTVSPRTEAELS